MFGKRETDEIQFYFLCLFLSWKKSIRAGNENDVFVRMVGWNVLYFIQSKWISKIQPQGLWWNVCFAQVESVRIKSVAYIFEMTVIEIGGKQFLIKDGNAISTVATKLYYAIGVFQVSFVSLKVLKWSFLTFLYFYFIHRETTNWLNYKKQHYCKKWK